MSEKPKFGVGATVRLLSHAITPSEFNTIVYGPNHAAGDVGVIICEYHSNRTDVSTDLLNGWRVLVPYKSAEPFLYYEHELEVLSEPPEPFTEGKEP